MEKRRPMGRNQVIGLYGYSIGMLAATGLCAAGRLSGSEWIMALGILVPIIMALIGVAGYVKTRIGDGHSVETTPKED